MIIKLEEIYTFKDFNDLNNIELIEILNGRNEEKVRMWMKSKRKITKKEHKEFILELKDTKTKKFLRVEREKEFVGVYSLTDINRESAIGGFWITDYAIKNLLVLSILFSSIKYVFDNYLIKEIKGYQKQTNLTVAKINKLLGFKEEDINNSEDKSEDKMINLVLTRDAWNSEVICNSRLIKMIEVAEARYEK
jgi:RimJ/RimL family protein N-acetyltransferase